MKLKFQKILASIAAIAAANSPAKSGQDEAAIAVTTASGLDNLVGVTRPLIDSFLPRFFAGHRSHSSHGSHGSHRSGTGGGYRDPPTYTPPPPPARQTQPPEPPVRRSDPLGQPAKPADSYRPAIPDASSLRNDAALRKRVIERVQLQLSILGEYKGPIDGVMGPQTRDAIDLYKIKKGAKRGGYLDSDTLNLLGVNIY